MNPPVDVLAGTACDMVPGTGPWGPGHYLIAANGRVEAGPFTAIPDALTALVWLEKVGHGIHPAPWTTRHSRHGLLIGSRIRERDRSPERVAIDLTSSRGLRYG